MIKQIFTQKAFYLFNLLIISAVLPAFAQIAQQNLTIILHDEALPITPTEFYIADVTDERIDRNAVGWLLPEDTKAPPKLYPVDLQGGGLPAIKHFVQHAFQQNSRLRPVVVALKKCMVTEIALSAGKVEGKIVVELSFSIQQGEELQHLIDYSGSAVYTRKAGPAQEVEPTLRKVLGNGLTYFNTWMDKQAGVDIKLAKSVKVSFTEHQERPEGDTIYYSFKRPLTWDDFKSKVPDSRFAAEVYPSMGYDEHTDVVNGVIQLVIDLKVFLPKSAAWVREGDRSSYVLNHEQRHFDIAKIAAERFKQKIEAENLPVANYDGPINVDYLDAYREMTSMELQYDKETNHGQDRFMQEKWNDTINKDLKAITKNQDQ
jgi:hypothetical protein